MVLELERSPFGSLREYIVNHSGEKPTNGTRLRMALEFAEGVEYVHSKDIIWNNVSTRKALLFKKPSVKLNDFSMSYKEGDNDKPKPNYETRYEMSLRNKEPRAKTRMSREIFALGCAVYEIMEWKVPYSGDLENDIEWRMPLCLDLEDAVLERIGLGDLPVISEDNQAGNVIRECWGKELDTDKFSAKTVVEELNNLITSEGLRSKLVESIRGLGITM